MDKIEIVNIVDKFLYFYQLALEQKASEEERWALWQEHYHFAAVPPGVEGQQLARKLLADAWEKYPAHIDYIKTWKANETIIQTYLEKVKEVLQCKEPIHLVIIYFVGGFEKNPFVAPYDETRLALCLPIETGNDDILLAHELTHIVHAKTASLSGDWERSIATVILEEGLATRVSAHIVPGENDREYVEFTEGWLEKCQKNNRSILSGIIPYLQANQSEILMRFTFGEGTTGMEREAYFVGWEIVAHLITENKWTFATLASIPTEQHPSLIGQAIDTYLNR